ncbi:MAG: HU family DNA-binding protein [Geobacteraceae bacterium]
MFAKIFLREHLYQIVGIYYPLTGDFQKGGNMTKAEIVGKIAEGAELTKAQAEKAASVFLDSIVEALKDGDKVTFVGFGTFSVSDKAARVGRNPQTGAEIKIPAKKAVKFKVGKALQDAVQSKKKKPAKKK